MAKKKSGRPLDPTSQALRMATFLCTVQGIPITTQNLREKALKLMLRKRHLQPGYVDLLNATITTHLPNHMNRISPIADISNGARVHPSEYTSEMMGEWLDMVVAVNIDRATNKHAAREAIHELWVSHEHYLGEQITLEELFEDCEAEIKEINEEYGTRIRLNTFTVNNGELDELEDEEDAA